MMNTLFLGIVIFLIVLAVFDLVVGVSNDAVNFLNSAIGAKVAKFKTIVLIAAIGVFAGAAFILCYLVTNILHFGSFVAMGIAIALAIFLLIRSNLKFKDTKETSENDLLFKQILRTHNKTEC